MANSKDFVVGVVIGGIAGAVTSLLLAPKSGKELRGDIKEKSGELYQKTEPMREKGSEWVTIAKEKGTTMKQKMTQKGNEAGDKIEELVE